MFRIAIVGVLLGGLTVAPVDAQEAASLRQGIRIRVTPVQGKAEVGTFTRIAGDSLSYVSARAPYVPLNLALSEVKRVEVSAGLNRGRGALIDGLLGTGIGVAAGAILGAARYDTAAPLGAVGGAAGLVIGSVLGAIRGRESWRAVPLSNR